MNWIVFVIFRGFKKFNPKVDGKEVNIIYSTPSCYTKAVYDYVQTKNFTLDVKTDDFFPYADEPNRVWSGYFTSRAGSKRLERLSNNLLQVICYDLYITTFDCILLKERKFR